jgi:rubrerythrin
MSTDIPESGSTVPVGTVPGSTASGGTTPGSTGAGAASGRRDPGEAVRATPARPAPPATLEEFMVRAWAMEVEASQRYAEFADAMETHNNREVAELFRRMAAIEGRHAQRIIAEMGWREPPRVPPGSMWTGFEGPETPPIDDVHYLMQPWHALQLALGAEQRAQRFFAELAQAATDASVRAAARELEAEEQEHVELVRAWLAKVPEPNPDWAHDPDPPRYTD